MADLNKVERILREAITFATENGWKVGHSPQRVQFREGKVDGRCTPIGALLLKAWKREHNYILPPVHLWTDEAAYLLGLFDLEWPFRIDWIKQFEAGCLGLSGEDCEGYELGCKFAKEFHD